jgi:hypothetical protein
MAPPPPAAGPAPSLSAVSPGTLIEGASIRITGSNFHATPSGNRVTIDGVSATVTGGTTTELSVLVPFFDCRPQRAATVRVSVGGKESNAIDAMVEPAEFVDTEIGELLLLDDPAELCLQFSPAGAGAGEYLIGVGSAAERPNALLSASLIASTGQSASAGASVAPIQPRNRSRLRTEDPYTRFNDQLKSHAVSRERLHAWNHSTLVTPGGWDITSLSPSFRMKGASRSPGPTVGDQLPITVPVWGLPLIEACNAPATSITAEVRVVGQRAVFVTDMANPAADQLTDAEIQAASDAFDSFIYDTMSDYFGTPTDLDGNQRVTVVLTVEVNRALGGQVGGTVDLKSFFDPSQCPNSNLGEFILLGVPDPDNEAGTLPRSKSAVASGFIQTLAHEHTHIVQHSTRINAGSSSVALDIWEMEGQAMLASEVVGHAALGLGPGRDYDASTALSASGDPWYGGLMQALSAHYGHDLQGGRNPGAPAECTLLFIDAFAPTACIPGAGYGAAWSFMRYLADRYGPSWPGGEAGLMRDWIAQSPTLAGTANVAALFGRPFEELFAEWSSIHYLDGRLAGAGTELAMTSWDLQDIMASLGESAPLHMEERAFTEFEDGLSIRGGGTAYRLLTDDASRPATAIRVRGAGNAVLGSEMSPQLWIVRTR